MFLTLLREVSKGKSMLRAYTNYAVSGIEVKGKTADIGGGKDPSYLRFLNTTHATITSIDFKVEENKTIDLEKDLKKRDLKSKRLKKSGRGRFQLTSII